MEMPQHTTGVHQIQCPSVDHPNNEPQQMEDIVVATSSVTLSGMHGHCQDSLNQIRHQSTGHQINFTISGCAIEESKNKKKRKILIE